jgi:NADPH:quinone reductase
MKAIRFDQTGGPDVLSWRDVNLEELKSGEVRLRQKAIGLNYIDTYHRSGLYPVPMPSGLGLEAAAVIEALGPNVKGFKVGDRVAYGVGPIGAYAEVRNFPSNRLVKLPKSISDETAAGMMLKGMTVRYLLRAT